MKIQVLEDPDPCRLIWEKMWPAKGLFDLWPVRKCFHDAFRRPLRFFVARTGNRIKGLLPLVWNDETQNFVIFPGETWHDKTWIEQNRLIAENKSILEDLMASVPGPMHLRYLTASDMMKELDTCKIDETGYLFYPAVHDYAIENWLLAFPGKSRKKLLADIRRTRQQGISFRFNQREDLDLLLEMNLSAFGKNSYFSDPRFYQSFINLAGFLEKMGMLKITTILIDGEAAAVDMGAVYKNNYTVLAGGTNPEFAGIAKVINLFHLEWACSSRIDCVDFLCGDFNWKTRFHLVPRPLFDIRTTPDVFANGLYGNVPNAACA